MKKLSVYLPIVLIVFFASCKKDDKCAYADSSASAPANERTQLQDYLTAAAVTSAQMHTSGAYYVINVAGSGNSANICSGITVKYKGTFFPSGQQFDASTSASGVSFPLGRLIVGWQKLLPLIKSAGKIDMYIPPSLGYGYQNVTDPSTGAVVIPANSYLKFEVELLSVQ